MEEVEIRTMIMFFEEGLFGGKPLWKDKGSMMIDPNCKSVDSLRKVVR